MDSRKDSFIKRLIPARGYQFRERERGTQDKKKQHLSPLKYQRHAERARGLSGKTSWELVCSYYLHRSQTLAERRYARISLFEGLPGKFRLFLDLNFISRHKRRY